MQMEHEGSSPSGARIALDSLCPTQPRVRPFSSGKGGRDTNRRLRGGRCNGEVDALVNHQLLTGPSLGSPAPILPKEGVRSNGKRMQEHAYLAGLLRVLTVPLTLLTQRATATGFDAGSVHNP
jgi:hypothetical protein